MAAIGAAAAGCDRRETLDTAQSAAAVESPQYRIGPGDALSVFVWRNPELSGELTVRPDGRVSMPLIDDLRAADRTPTELARAIEASLSRYVQEPVVTVMVTGFVGPFAQQVRVVGAATEPAAIPYRANMTVLDAIIAVGGLDERAAGDRAVLVRGTGAERRQYAVRLDRLIRGGDIAQNVALLPGDILIIPESLF